MSTQDLTPGPNPPRRTKPALWFGGMAILICAAVIISQWVLPSRWRPQLEVKNTGTNAVTISFKGYRGGPFVTQPGETWHMRFSAGDTLNLQAGDGPAQTIQLPARNPKPWSLHPIAQRWTAEVNADDPKNIRLENRRFEEISSPPSAAEPWP